MFSFFSSSTPSQPSQESTQENHENPSILRQTIQEIAQFPGISTELQQSTQVALAHLTQLEQSNNFQTSTKETPGNSMEFSRNSLENVPRLDFELFSPLSLAIQSKNKKLVSLAIDCLAKLLAARWFNQFKHSGDNLGDSSTSQVEGMGVTMPTLQVNQEDVPRVSNDKVRSDLQEKVSLEVVENGEDMSEVVESVEGEDSKDTQQVQVSVTEPVTEEPRTTQVQVDEQVEKIVEQVVQQVIDETDEPPPSEQPSEHPAEQQPAEQQPSEQHSSEQQQPVSSVPAVPAETTVPVVPAGSILDLIIDTICDAFAGGESTPSQVQIQIVRALSVASTSTPSNPDTGIHGATLLKAIRTMYNVFLLSKDGNIQTLAQVSLQQVCLDVFARVKPLNDTSIKDAFLVFRALCKLCMKPVESITDLKSHGMRSKILSLYLLHQIVTLHPTVLTLDAKCLFGSNARDTSFLYAVKQYLVLITTRNLASPIPIVFDLVLDLFRQLVQMDSRTKMKKELSMLFVELILPILESPLESSVTHHQRSSLLRGLTKTFKGRTGGQLLVEIYLNYDCDPEGTSRDNVWERLVSAVCKWINVTPVQAPPSTIPSTFFPDLNHLPTITTQNMITLTKSQIQELYSPIGDGRLMRIQGLELLDTILSSLWEWIQDDVPERTERSVSMDEDVDTPFDRSTFTLEKNFDKALTLEKQKSMDDPTAFESVKQKKLLLSDGIRKFNWKPKKGLAFLIQTGLVPSSSPQDVAKFLFNTQGLNKTTIGEFLGEGEEEAIQTMHAFVDLMNFHDMTFTNALRHFLQSFRLPGEAQKIDRFMLKFAERYLNDNPSSFSSADTAYVLAYSVIMLNTDLHNPQIKKHMTKEEFVKNNRGIDNGADLDRVFLESIYDEISTDEIKMKDEIKPVVQVDVFQPRPRALAQEMADKTEALFTKLVRLQKAKAEDTDAVPESHVSSTWFHASHRNHVKQMLDLVWMSVLTGLSGPLQSSDDEQVTKLCLRGLKLAIWISCRFEMELETKAFVSTLGKFTQLVTLGEMGPKNLEAIRVLLEIAATQGDALRDAWRDVATCISQLDKLSLLQATPRVDSAMETTNQDFVVAVDRIFSNSPRLSGRAINDFVTAMCHVSWQEIETSSTWDHPRMYSLQKLVEISYYNMNRIRVEWTSLWNILGSHFNKCGTHSNPTVAAFALDKLRQLANKFLDIEELPNFKFQKDFLKPFEYILANAPDPNTKDLVLHCIQQTIQLKSQNIKSGWRTIFNVINRSAREPQASLVQFGFNLTKTLYQTHFDQVLENNSLPEFINCLVEFCKNRRFPKINLQSMELLKSLLPRIATLASKQTKTPASQLDDPNFRFWFPVLFGLYEIIMTCELEVRTRALTTLFETLRTFGNGFTRDFWEVVCKGVLFPIFDDLKLSRMEKNRFDGEDMNIWLSTTLIKALREFVDLFGVYFDQLGFVVDGLLDLFAVCMTQENETLARIGSTSFLQFVGQNVGKFDKDTWGKVSSMFNKLFKETTPLTLFEPNQEKDFSHTVMKCVLQLLVIQTLDEMLQVPGVYESIDSQSLLQLLDLLEGSYRFAKKFNDDMPLRQSLYQAGYMGQLPNLLKQETISATSYLGNLVRLSKDTTDERVLAHDEAVKRWIPLSRELLLYFSTLDPETKKRNVQAWKPVILLILNGLSDMADEPFKKNMAVFYAPCCDLLLHDLAPEVRQALHKVLLQTARVFDIHT